MTLNKKILGAILGTGAVGGGVATYLYLNKSDTVQENAPEILDQTTKNKNLVKRKTKGAWKQEYENLDFKLDFSQGPIKPNVASG